MAPMHSMSDVINSVEQDSPASLQQRIEELASELERRTQIEAELRDSLERSRAMEETLAALVETSASLTGTLESADVLASILEAARRLVPADASAIWRFDANSDRWQIVSCSGISTAFQQASVRVLEQAKRVPDFPVIAEDVFASPALSQRAEAFRAEGIRSLLGVPLRIHGAVCGSLVFYYRHRRSFSENEVRIATAVANMSAAAISSHELFSAQTRLCRVAQESEQRFARFMQHFPGLAWIKDAQGRYVYANDAATRAFRKGRDELYGQTDDEVFPPDTAAQFKANDQRALAGPAGVQTVETLEHEDGVVHYSIVSKFPIPREVDSGALVGGMAIDITERRRAEMDARFLSSASAALAALVDYESALQNVARLAVPAFADWCAVDMLDADGALRRLAVAHVDPAKVQVAHELHRRYPPDPEAFYGVWNILRTGQSELTSEISDEMLVATISDAEHLSTLRQLGLKSYMAVPLSIRGKPLGVMTFIAAESGRRYDANDLAMAEDLAHRSAIAIENARLYQTLTEADQRKNEFLALLGHELRNPLAPIRNSLHVLRLPGADAAITERAQAMMERQIEQLVRLVDDLLDVSRIMRGKVELRREPIELATVVARAVETSQPLIDAEAHRLTVSVAPDPLWVHGDLVRLAQVISNLLNNAAKYTERGGEIFIGAERAGDEAVIRVRDTGIGIPRDALPRLFDMFYQADRRTKESQGGLGIGLSLVQRLVELHGGAVEAHSAGRNAGSEFIIRLPLIVVDQSANGQHSRQAPQQQPKLAPRRVLVVDDNKDAADSLAMLLRLQGQNVSTAYDGPSALVQAEREPPAIAFLDLGMPQMDGCELARAFRARSELQHVELVAVTGWGQPEDRQRTAAAGFDHHLVKPIEAQALYRLLEEPC